MQGETNFSHFGCLRLRDIENDIISLTSKNESGGSLAMQGETNLSLGCKIEI